jgi:hypothetical protein
MLWYFCLSIALFDRWFLNLVRLFVIRCFFTLLLDKGFWWDNSSANSTERKRKLAAIGRNRGNQQEFPKNMEDSITRQDVQNMRQLQLPSPAPVMRTGMGTHRIFHS